MEQVLTRRSDSEHRTGLANAERVDGIGLPSAFGITRTQIARRTRASEAAVTAVLAVTASEMARAVTARYDFLDLTQAAIVAAFDNNPDAVQARVIAARNSRSCHVAQRLRDECAYAANRVRAADRLGEIGVRVIDTPTGVDPTRSLHQLGDGDGAS